jgi:hypothetical protein
MLRLLPALLTLVCFTSCGVTASAQGSASPLGDRSSISAMNGFSAARLPPPQLDPQLAAMQANGVQVVRSDAAWAVIEPQPPGPYGHDWQFSQTDAWVTELATHNLRWEPILDYSVRWAKTCSGFCPPDDDGAYATFAQAVAARYGANGSFWSEHPTVPYHPVQIFEIWNEENTSTFWATGPVAATRYASLYSAARRAIHAVDPQASVIVGGLAEDSSAYNPNQDYAAWFVEWMFAARPSLKGNVDGFGLHPYGATAADVEEWVAHFRRVLTSLGEGSAPIDLTEFGWATGQPSRETWRASMMSTLGRDLARSDCGIGLLAPYTWINPGAPTQSGDFGLVEPTGTDTTLRPAGTAWFNGLSAASSLPEIRLCQTSGTTVAPLGL